jgi:hypothetical protein
MIVTPVGRFKRSGNYAKRLRHVKFAGSLRGYVLINGVLEQCDFKTAERNFRSFHREVGVNVVVSDVQVDGEYDFTRRVFGSLPEALRSLAAWLVALFMR